MIANQKIDPLMKIKESLNSKEALRVVFRDVVIEGDGII
jgi:hypothetical protein